MVMHRHLHHDAQCSPEGTLGYYDIVVEKGEGFEGEGFEVLTNCGIQSSLTRSYLAGSFRRIHTSSGHMHTTRLSSDR